MPSKAIAAIGTLSKSGDAGAPEVFGVISEVLDITGPELTAEELEVTNHTSTQNFKEYIPALLDAGNVTFDMNMVQADSSQRRIHTDWINRVQRNYQLVFPPDLDASPVADRTIQFRAFVSRFTYNAPVAGVLRRSLTLRTHGAPIFGVGT